MDGEVLIAPPNYGGTSRDMYTDSIIKLILVLAISCSIRDWIFSDLGVILNPIVDVFEIDHQKA